MAVLNIAKTIELRASNPKAHMLMDNEPDNLVVQLFSQASYIRQASDQLSYANYDNLEFDKDDLCMSSSPVSQFGIKNFPKVGAIGFFKTKFTKRTFLVAPIRTAQNKLPAPTLALAVNQSNITVTVTDISANYMYYRILMYNGYFAYEYVSCNDTFNVPKPAVKGNYKAVLVAYEDDGGKQSLDSNVVSFTIDTGEEDFTPVRTSYTKEEIDQLLANL